MSSSAALMESNAVTNLMTMDDARRELGLKGGTPVLNPGEELLTIRPPATIDEVLHPKQMVLNEHQRAIMRETYLHQGRHIFRDMEDGKSTRVS